MDRGGAAGQRSSARHATGLRVRAQGIDVGSQRRHPVLENASATVTLGLANVGERKVCGS